MWPLIRIRVTTNVNTNFERVTTNVTTNIEGVTTNFGGVTTNLAIPIIIPVGFGMMFGCLWPLIGLWKYPPTPCSQGMSGVWCYVDPQPVSLSQRLQKHQVWNESEARRLTSTCICWPSDHYPHSKKLWVCNSCHSTEIEYHLLIASGPISNESWLQNGWSFRVLLGLDSVP